MAVGMAGRMMTTGDKGKRLHLLQREGERWPSLCRLNDQFADGEPLQGRELNDVTCKTCRRIMAQIWSKK